MPAVRRTRTMKALWRAHRVLYRISGGRLGTKMFGMPVLLLTTIGRRSGKIRTNALYHLEDGDNFVVIGSNAGEDYHPAWVLNLRAHPRARIQKGRHALVVNAREAEGDERARLWARAVAADPAYATYQERTTRRIPVVVLEPAGPGRPPAVSVG